MAVVTVSTAQFSLSASRKKTTKIKEINTTVSRKNATGLGLGKDKKGRHGFAEELEIAFTE